MAILYKGNATNFTNMGLGPLNDAISILVTEERNGIFELEMKYPVNGVRFKEIKVDRLIKADAGTRLKDQRFKIVRITKPKNGIITVYAEHVSYLTQDLALKPRVAFDGNAQVALDRWKANLVDDNPFIVSSDISTTGKGEWTIDKIETPRRALGGVAGSMLDIYGGEYLFDNYQIRLMNQRGVNSGALIAYGRNLIDATQEESIADTYTSVYPYAVYQDDSQNEILLTLPEFFVDSEHVNKYARRKILPIDFSDEEPRNVDRLRSLTKQYIKANDVGVPKVNLKLKYVDLSNTLDHKNMNLIEEVSLCDNVPVLFERMGINTKAKVIKTVWDDLVKAYDSIELGEARSSLSSAINATVDGKIESVANKVNSIQLQADGIKLIYRQTERPPDGTHVGDLWYQPNGEFTSMYQWDGIDWREMINSADLEMVKREVSNVIAQADADRANAEKKFNQAVSDSKAYSEAKAAELTGEINTVKTEVTNTVNDAVTKADNAINLRVQKGDVVGQINVEAGQTLIQNNKILLDGNTYIIGTTFANDIKTKSLDAVKANISDLRTLMLTADTVTSNMIKSDTALIDKLFATDANVNKLTAKNAFINAVKATDITADRITGGTFNGATMNVINLNASSIVANSLSAITTQTGALDVTGWLTMATENKGILGSYDFGDKYGEAFNYRWFTGEYRLSHRHLIFSADSYNVNSNNTKGSFRYYTETFYGPDYVKMRQFNLARNVLYNRVDINADRITLSNSYNTSNIALAADGSGFFSGNLQVNGDLILTTTKALKAYYVQPPDAANNIYINGARPELGGMRFGLDGSALNGGRLVASQDIYNRTYSSAGNMVVFDTGTIGRSVSARKYKLNIKTNDLLETAIKTLEIKPSTWFDKGEVESISENLTNETIEELDANFKLQRHYGFIADDFHEKGATEVVIYDSNGEVEGLAYDRLSMYHHEMIRDLYGKIGQLEKTIQEMEIKNNERKSN